MMDVSMSVQEIRRSFLEDIRAREIYIPETGFLAGPTYPVREMVETGIWKQQDYGWDNLHFPLNYKLLMQEGVPGIIRRASVPHDGLSEEQQEYRALIAESWNEIGQYILRHAEKAEALASERPEDAARLRRIAQNCRTLSCRAPETFEQGVQLFWFIWRLRGNYTSCIGRMDVHLRELYEKDVPGRISREKALDILCELWERLNETYSGDTLMNIMLGGVDENGEDVSCDLSILIMEATMRVAKSEPHINVRIHPGSKPEFLDAAVRLIAMGQGQGVTYFDDNIIPALVKRGIPLELARIYANDGCTEITFDSHSAIWFWQMESVKSLELALFRGKENPSTPFRPYNKWSILGEHGSLSHAPDAWT